ncbi:MAG: Sulfate permease and related transporters (MFS superfamily) [uncultured Paraburkholderia sp.]|nr:MAG: Sulfate permease and related transporters (MFS superfamily) [uncultured Paraburkholderia sp.]CAH2927115.1 MAG: Sulfate permease and related transporters (MFS superfamily) [uncultured Paraburkholderia sp.]
MRDFLANWTARASVLKGVLPLNRAAAMRDALAGVQLASMDIPQVLGYARIAGMPAVTGLYTVFLPLIAFALFGASQHLVVAADSATATIFASRLSTMAPVSSAEYASLAAMVALLTAALLLIARIFKLGFLADFLSRTVLVGFLAGVGVQVGIAMLGDMLGLPGHAARMTDQLVLVALHWAQLNVPTLAISVLVVSAVLVFKRVWPRLPVPLIAVVAGIAASDLYGFAAHGIAVLGPVTGGLPALRMPSVTWQQMLDLVPVAASCFVMIVAQSAAASRVFAERHHEAADTNTDLLGIAAANAAAAWSGAFVVNGSPTQTAMADRGGTRSQFAQIVFAAVVALVLLFFSRFLQYLPRCILASIVFTIAVGLVDLRTLFAIRRESPGEFALAVSTAAAVVLIGVEHGILLAVAVSLLRHVRHSYRPHTMILAPGDDGLWIPVPAVPGTQTARLSLRRRPVLCERPLFRRRYAQPDRPCAEHGALLRDRCERNYRPRLFGGTLRGRAVRPVEAERYQGDVRAREPLPALGHGPARHYADHRRKLYFRHLTRSAACSRGSPARRQMRRFNFSTSAA